MDFAPLKSYNSTVNHKIRILIPIPRKDFDPTEVAVPWRTLTSHGVQISFATPDGKPAECDPLMLTGRKLGLLAPILMADKNARNAYQAMQVSEEFLNPSSWEQVKENDFDGIILPGGHAKGMTEYLESQILQKLVAEFFAYNKPVGAICHGVVLVARSQLHGKSVLHGRKTTSLLKTQELTGWWLTRLWLKDYYRTYPQTVEKEVKSCLADISDFFEGPLPLFRDSPSNLKPGFALLDGNYLSARWPGDAHLFAVEFLKLLHPRAL